MSPATSAFDDAKHRHIQQELRLPLFKGSLDPEEITNGASLSA
ncbi:hypothetical protein TRICHSKD4_0506 [Roseibium sp. TrichSKD4]|nr:hypothetical protein TRICHSKD4_0506 [Roseibium sp. TrichSKD4]